MNNFYTNVVKWGNNILLRQITDGEVVNSKIHFEPTMFIPSNKETGYTGFYGEKLEPKLFNSMNDCREFIKSYKDVPNFDVHGNDNYVAQYLSETYPDGVEYDLSQIRIANFDIENDKAPDGSFAKTTNPLGAITAITLYDNIDDTYYIFSTFEWYLKDTVLDFIVLDNSEFTFCSSEKDLLTRFINHIHSKQYHAFTGWNIEGYDIPYLVNRCHMIVGEKVTKRLSPWGIIKEHNRKDDFGNPRQTYELLGTATLDYLVLYKKFTYGNKESYKLDHIGFIEVGERKMDYSEASSLHALGRSNPQKFLDYNIKDVDLVKRIDDKMKLIDLIFTLAYYAKVNVNDILSPVRTWDTIIYNKLKENNIVVPPMKINSKSEKYAGAYVQDPKIGFSDWIVSVDLASLYPSLIIQYNLGTDTILESKVDINIIVANDGKRHVDDRLVSKDFNLSKYTDIVAANGTMYRKDRRGVLSELMAELYESRKQDKLMMLKWEKKLAAGDNSQEVINNISKYKNLQMAKKILLNSCYGAVGNKHFRYFDLRIAEAITLSGQLSIKWIARKINEFMNNLLKTTDKEYIAAIDTDSCYIEFGDMVKKVFPKDTPNPKIVDALDKFVSAKFEPFLEKSYEELAEYMNAYENKMVMEREVIADKAFWTAKKRYVLSVWDNEGVRYKEPKIKIMGLESKKSSTPQLVRTKLEQGYKLMLTTPDDSIIIKFIEEFETEWNALSVEEISFPRGCNGVSKYGDDGSVFKSKCPIHVKGALYHNKLVKELGLENEIETIKDGDKVKFVPLIQPNPARSPVISYKDQLPKEFNLHKYIDYRSQFNKAFIEPMKSALDAVNWKHEDSNDLSDLFG